MKLAGWKTNSIFKRYAIVDETDLRDAVQKVARVGDRFGKNEVC